MKLLLTHGYFLHEDPKEQEIMRPYPPLGILYLSAFLKKKKIDVRVFDSTFSRKEDLSEYLLQHRPAYIGIYVNLMTKLNVLEIIRFVRASPALKSTKIILGGPEVRYHAENFLRSGADIIVIGEGEETLYEVISTLDTPFNPFLDTIRGIAFRNLLDEIVFTEERTKIKDIDQLPFPDREAIDLNRYFTAWKNKHGLSAASINTMRGCPYTCKWCSRAVYGLSYRRRSAALVAEELEEVLRRWNPDTFWFTDDVFTISHVWLRNFAEELKKRNLSIRYECITRADRMNAEVVELLRETGCFRVWIGAESGSQKIIDRMDRRVEVQQVRDMIRLSKENGIESGTFIMLGYPGETRDDIEETVLHLQQSDPDLFTITVAYPITGTEFFTEVEANITGKLPWQNSTDRDTKFVRTYSDRFYHYAVRYVYNRVYLHKTKLKKDFFKALRFRVRILAARAGMWRNRTSGAV